MCIECNVTSIYIFSVEKYANQVSRELCPVTRDIVSPSIHHDGGRISNRNVRRDIGEWSVRVSQLKLSVIHRSIRRPWRPNLSRSRRSCCCVVLWEHVFLTTRKMVTRNCRAGNDTSPFLRARVFRWVSLKYSVVERYATHGRTAESYISRIS